jgi:intracellular septation protein A
MALESPRDLGASRRHTVTAPRPDLEHAPTVSTGVVTDELERVSVSARDILVGSGPRFARDAFGPVLVFYLGYKLGGVMLGIAVATLASLCAWQYERRRERSGLLAWLTLLIVAVQAIVGVVANDARAYLAPSVLATLAWALVFIGSVIIRRPLAGLFAGEMYPFPPEVRASRTFQRVFSAVSLAWGAMLLLRSGVRLATLSESSIDAFVLVNAVTGFPLTVAMMSWSVWYAVRAFRRSEEWGWALAN